VRLLELLFVIIPYSGNHPGSIHQWVSFSERAYLQ
jgi:hypothetical protein